MKNPTVLLFALATAVINFSLWQTQPTAPPWLTGGPNAICDDASPCEMPTEVFAGVQLSIAWYEADGVTPCPAPAVNEHPQTPCGPDPQIRQWVAFSRGDQAWLPTSTDHVALVSQSALYSGGPNPIGVAEFSNGSNYALGAVVTFALPASVVQAPQLPVLDAVAWQQWFDAACLQNPTCSTGGAGLDQPTFDAFLATSPFSTHNHGFGFTLTRAESLDGVTHNGITSVPQ